MTTDKRYIYVLEAYAYSDFETHILSHKTSMSKKMFFKIVKKAQELCATKNYVNNSLHVDYVSNMIVCLCKEFGFEQFDYPCIHIGCSPKSSCTMFVDDEVIEK